ncbi:G-patch domain [Rhizoctonia solani]|uniref:G-patch domain n=1 Tax=Rhizoctonia solani TaxID=456999 RepID=A0A8H7IH27_9AGAM|nr:G-patch domain [Rhizoctonia solani]
MSSNVSFTVRPPPRTFETDTPEPSRPGSASPPIQTRFHDEHDTKEMITGFDAMGVQRVDGAQATPDVCSRGAKVGTGVDGSQGGLGTRGKINDGPQLSGLIVTKVKQEDGEDIKMEEVDVEVKEEQDEPAKEEEPMDEDQRALRALLRGEQGNEVKREIAAISVQDQPGGWAQPKTEADAFKEDLATRPDEVSPRKSRRLRPCSHRALWEAMLRGMGMGRPSKKAIQPYIPEARPALLGIGAKPRPVDEVDQGKGKKFARPDKRYVPILKVERNGSGQSSRRTSRSRSKSPQRDRESDRKDRDRRDRDYDRRDRDRDRDYDRDKRRDRDYDRDKRRDYDSDRDRDREKRRDRDDDKERRRDYDDRDRRRDDDRDRRRDRDRDDRRDRDRDRRR